MPSDIFKFSSPDLANLQKWYKRAPKEFIWAANNMTGQVALLSRRMAVKIIEKNTTTRNKKFVSRSMRVQKSTNVSSMNQIIANMGSVDISTHAYKSTGFSELESGKKMKRNHVPTLKSRGGSEGKKVTRAIRMDRLGGMFKFRNVRSGNMRSKRAKVAAMIRVVKSGAIGRKPFVIPSGLTSGPMSNMRPGVYKLGNKKTVELQNPFQSSPRNTQRIKWSIRAARLATRPHEVRKIWHKEIKFVTRNW